MAATPQLSVVSPVYQSAANLPVLVSRILDAVALRRIHCEILLVDDGSTDTGWEVIRSLAQAHPQVKGIRLDRNYGQHSAIRAGLMHATGTLVVVMDCDLQDPPKAIPAFLDALKEDVDAVFARRIKQYDTAWQRTLSHLFYRLLSRLTRIPMDGSVANFGLYRRAVIRAMLDDRSGKYFFFPLNVRRYARRAVQVPVEHARRHAGSSAYDMRRAGALALRILISQSFLYYFYASRSDNFQVSEITEETAA